MPRLPRLSKTWLAAQRPPFVTAKSFSIWPTSKLDTPQARIFPAARKLSNAVTATERSISSSGWPTRPVQQIKIEVVSAETGKARLASARGTLFHDMSGPYFGNQKYAVALPGNRSTDQFLGLAAAVNLRRVDQSHPERKTSAQCLLFNRSRAPSVGEMQGALTKRGDKSAVSEFYRAPRNLWSCLSCCSKRLCRNGCAERKRRAQRCRARCQAEKTSARNCHDDATIQWRMYPNCRGTS